MEEQARVIVDTMEKAGVRRLIFVSSMGIHDEILRESWNSSLGPYQKSAEVIENSGLDYTIIRPAWLNDVDESTTERPRRGSRSRTPRASSLGRVLRTSW